MNPRQEISRAEITCTKTSWAVYELGVGVRTSVSGIPGGPLRLASS